MDDGTKKILLFIGGVIWAMRSSTKAYAPTLNVVHGDLGPTPKDDGCPPGQEPNILCTISNVSCCRPIDSSKEYGHPESTPSPYMPTIQVEYTQEACERAYNTYNRIIPEVIAKYGSKEDYIKRCKVFGTG